MGTDGGCGCARRRDRLNRMWPGLGDLVGRLLDPVARYLNLKGQ